jgi:endoglucanase
MGNFTYKTGVNLGGWLSQREVPQAISGLSVQEHRNSFITKSDIERIADWGFDHVRLPFDYELIEDDASPFSYNEEGFSYIENCLEWCRENGLGVILDFHRAPGQSYSLEQRNPLLANSQNRERYLSVWNQLVRRYSSVGDELIFELLNEVVDITGYMYKSLIQDCLKLIREVDTSRKIIVGGNHCNSIYTLKELPIDEDPALIYTFHYYEPVPFTHQKAYFAEDMKTYNQTVAYPGGLPDFIAFLSQYPQFADKNKAYAWTNNDKAQMEKYLSEVQLFLEHVKRPLYCGEFGVIDGSPVESKVAWLNDLVDILNQYKIGKAYWSYKEMDYGLVDIAGHVRNQDVIKAVTKQ